jgi:hypothetical protein
MLMTPHVKRRRHTLEAMQRAVTECASLLSTAAVAFRASRELRGDDLKHQVHTAKRAVEEALQSIYPIQVLVEVRPEQIILTSNSMSKTTAKIVGIIRVSAQLTARREERLSARAIPALARRCDQIAQQLTDRFGREITQAQRGISDIDDQPPRALTA